jgi:hypothetical protein
MSKLYPHRHDDMHSKYARFLAGFWAFLVTLYLISIWN